MIRLLAACGLTAAIAAADLPRPAEVDALIDRAQAWMATQGRSDGALVPGTTFTVGITALAATSLASPPRALPADNPVVARAVAYVARFRQADGGVYDPNEGLGCYGTSLALLLATRLPDGGRPAFDSAAMQRYLLGLQNRESGKPGSGGIGYGDKGPGSEDLSNTSYAILALRGSGYPASAPEMQAALGFLQRCQDLKSVNPAPWAGETGGGVYGPQDAARSWEKGDQTQSSRWTASGTMTYSLVSSYLALDLRPGDPRVDAAIAWLGANWGFAANPGMGPGKEGQGLYHLHALAATAFDLLGQPQLRLADGREVDWRIDLWQAVSARAHAQDLGGGVQGAYWLNDAPRWAEGMPQLCTGYALRALKAIRRALPP